MVRGASMELKELEPQITRLLKELDVRTRQVEINRRYIDGNAPIPDVVSTAKMTKSYRQLMPLAEAPWASVVVDSVQDRLQVGGISTGDQRIDREIWETVWQANGLDAESKLAQNGTLTDGRTFATIWPDKDKEPEVVFDGADQMIVEYRQGRHQARHRTAALRRWTEEDGLQRITLYHADAIYKFVQVKGDSRESSRRFKAGPEGKLWKIREVAGESFPLKNHLGVVPVVEILTNRRLRSGAFPYARGEFQHCIGLIDRINYLTYLGLVVAIWMGFPIRGVSGNKLRTRVLRDDQGEPLIDPDSGKVERELVPPFESRPDSVLQIENPQGKAFQLEAADRSNLSPGPELGQLAAVTKTPSHFFPMATGLSNISADMIIALEGGMYAKVEGIHQPFIGEGIEEIIRVGALIKRVKLPATTKVLWMDHRARGLGERADAAQKLIAAKFPQLFVAEHWLDLDQDQLQQLRAAQVTDALNKLLEEVGKPAPSTEEEGALDAPATDPDLLPA